MSVKLMQELLEAAGDTAELCGGSVLGWVDGKKVRLGGPLNDSNTFELTAEGRELLQPKEPEQASADDQIDEDA